ncbi:uncharacterized protein TrAFT101_010852 [Trichoderma asperellum]|uniref:Uncharacterized protein n=1 Tax=Trichoderma asperellum (strain ATCC 204424 / CBS 433.97 / NBRC 101777) TaxID=1042311 RepID=A0A2T3YX58_TRIA4|nr:hypothetical protein M441DRAFT_92425 [Trichoderma asperellum CBS 433.97]PTB37120.1 hypothetical protein M441DRAFT_92425 [Trichoderma asperellum CBS 433.97]UKZ96052.1 hypothetical protein TrAFT101_010852 [Trichoderma asperellum]
MCVHFQSWNRCSSCLLTFNRRRNRVPCWNGSLSHWRIHHHGLSCRNGQYERAPDEVYTHRCCEACRLEAANRAAADEKSGGAVETSDETAVARLGWRNGKRAGRLAAAATTRRRRATNVKKMLLLRWWALKEALCGRGSVCKRKGGEKRLARARIWMLGYL